MNFKRFQTIIFLLLISFLTIYCDCGKGSSGNKRQPTRKKGGKYELTKEQKEELNKLVKEEKVLEGNFKNTLDKLIEQKGKWGAELATGKYKEIQKFKKDPAALGQEIDSIEETLLSLSIFEPFLKQDEGLTLPPYLQEQFLDHIADTPELREAIAEARPINRKRLSTSEQLFYDYITMTYPATKNDPSLFVNKLVTESVRSLIEVNKPLLLLYQNIQRQHELKKAKS